MSEGEREGGREGGLPRYGQLIIYFMLNLTEIMGNTMAVAN